MRDGPVLTAQVLHVLGAIVVAVVCLIGVTVLTMRGDTIPTIYEISVSLSLGYLFGSSAAGGVAVVAEKRANGNGAHK